MQQEQAMALLVLLKPLLQSVDTAPPAIAPTVTVVRPSEAKIKWKTRDRGDATVEYGPTARYGAAERKRKRTHTHRFVLRGLAPGSTYHYRVSSRDGAGDVAVSRDFYFTTADAPAVASVSETPSQPAVGGASLSRRQQSRSAAMPVSSGLPSPSSASRTTAFSHAHLL